MVNKMATSANTVYTVHSVCLNSPAGNFVYAENVTRNWSLERGIKSY